MREPIQFECTQCRRINYNATKDKKQKPERIQLKKVSWSTRQEVIDATWIVLISTVVLGIFIAGTDFLLAKFIRVIIR